MIPDKLSDMTQIAILIPVFNGLDYTKNCLENLHIQISLVKSEVVQFPIIIIDDGSTDGTSEWIGQNYADVHIVKGNGNLWWSGGINKGAEFAIEQLKVDFVLLWNNDIYALDNYFSNLAEAVTKQLISEDEIIGSKIYVNYQEKLLWSVGGIFDSRSGKKYMMGYHVHEHLFSSDKEVISWLPGMGTLVPVNIIKSIGFWDEQNFPQYFGDSEFTLRASRKGFSIRVLNDLILENDITNTTIKHQDSFRRLIRTFYDKKSLFNIKFQLRFYRRFATSPKAYWYLFMNYFKYVGGFFKWKILKALGVQKQNDIPE